VSIERAKEQLELSEGRWENAIREHAQPPPDAGFSRRLRALAAAADEAVESLSRSRTGLSVVAIAHAFGQLSSAAWELAAAVDQGQRERARAG